jgi:hypothetical protein
MRRLFALAVALALLGTAAPALAVITQEGFTTAASGTGDNDFPGESTFEIARPGTTATGDVLVAQIAVEGLGDNLICPPSGWTSILRTQQGSDSVMETFFRVVADIGTEPTTYVWQLKETDCVTGDDVTGQEAVGGIIAYGGVDTANPIFDSGGTSASGTTIDAPSLPDVPGDPDVPQGSRVVRFCANDKEFAITATGLIYSATAQNDGAQTVKPTGGAADAEQATTGPTGTVTCSNNGNGG